MSEQEDILELLSEMIQDGTFKHDVQHRDMGAALSRATTALGDFSGTIDQIDAVSRHCEVFMPALQGQARTEVADAIELLLNTATHLEASDQRDALDKVSPMLDRSKDKSKILTSRLREAWQLRLQSNFDKEERLGRVLSKFGDFAALGAKMTSDASAGLALVSRFPIDDETKQRFDRFAQKIKEHLAALNQTKTSKGQLDFLLKVAQQKATLEDLTGDVLTWLSEQKAKHLFMLRL